MKRTYIFFLLVVGAALLFEASGPQLVDPWAQLGWYYHADISSWPLSAYLPVHFILSLLEVFLIIVALIWWTRKGRLKQAFWFVPGTLIVPLLVFTGMLAFGVLYGLFGGGNFTFALWEVRGFLMMVSVYLLTGIFIREEKHLDHLVWVILIAGVALAVENMLRLALFSPALEGDDLAFDHVDSVVLALGMVLSLNLLAFGGTRAQKRFAAIAFPIMFIATNLMKRRAAFVVLVVGVLVLTIFLLRLRPRVFWKVVPPLAILFAIYLAAFWHDSSAAGQLARAISSQFTPDARDFSSNLYRLVEHGDIVANIQSAPITGLGFGQQFIFYFPLPDVGSKWPFWRYTTHNAVLWVWMKDGVFGFIAFWWLLGRATYDGARVVETQREEWAFVAWLRSRLGSRKASESLWKAAIPLAPVMLRPSAGAGKYTIKRKHVPPKAFGLNVPAWERTDKLRSVTARRSGAVALLVAGICMVPMQITYSYVDLGLTSERNMLLFGMMLGIVGRGAMLLGIQQDKHRIGKTQEAPNQTVRRQQRTRGRPQHKEVPTTPAQLLSPEETHEAVRNLVMSRVTASPRTSSDPSPMTRPPSRPLSDKGQRTEAGDLSDLSRTPGAYRPLSNGVSSREATTAPPEHWATTPMDTPMDTGIEDGVTAPPAEDSTAAKTATPPSRTQAHQDDTPPTSRPIRVPDAYRERLPWERITPHSFEE